MSLAFFLGANSAHGFYSLYDELINPDDAERVYILKGGPGSGKSSIMRKAVSAAEEKKIPVELIYCSSDPDSLDGVIFPTLRKAIVDGTAPHIVEPKFPLAVEQYVDLGRFADIDAISLKKEEIVKAKGIHSEYFRHIYRLTLSALQIENELFDIALGGISLEKLKKRAKGIISRELNGKGFEKSVKRRFSSAISPKGYISSIADSVINFTHIYAIEDDFGLSHFLLTPIADAFSSSDFGCIKCLNPLNPERLEHLLVPELSLAFITSSKEIPYKGVSYRKIRLNSSIDKNVLKSKKHRISILKKLKSDLIADACNLLAEAKLSHDKLEDLYNPHIDFDSLYDYAEKLIAEIFK